MISSSQTHRQVWEQIPWILNGSASEADVRAAEEHLRQCADCREALAFEQRMHEALKQQAEVGLSEAEAGWQRLSARLDRGSAGSQQRLPRRQSAPYTRWLAAAVIVEALALGAVVAFSSFDIAGRVPSGAYTTLSRPEAIHPAATIRVVLSPSMTLEQFRVLLNGAHLQVVAGPGESGVWSLAPAEDAGAAATDTALRELRQSPSVRFAEPIGDAARARSP
jgi:hypothetical protein